jgi:hypothetical protein
MPELLEGVAPMTFMAVLTALIIPRVEFTAQVKSSSVEGTASILAYTKGKYR